MTGRHEWVCWRLTREEMDTAVRELGIDPDRLDESDRDRIARLFVRGLEYSVPDPMELLKCAVEEVMDDKDGDRDRHRAGLDRGRGDAESFEQSRR